MDKKEDLWRVVKKNEAREQSWYWIMTALMSLILYQSWNIRGNM